jgi:transcriptional regulator with XRE-family HTH domain
MGSALPGTAWNAELGDFLRSRRARVTPQEVGLATKPRRRVPGLRREEVALLAGVSADYYIRLERGRPINASDSVLDAVAHALRLDDTERAHLFALSTPHPQARRGLISPQRVRPSLYLLLDSIQDTPALILGCRLDVLATNKLARAMYTDFEAVPRPERNFVRYIFLDESARDLYVDWGSKARGMVASLHLYAGRHPQDPLLAELVDDLSARDEDFRRWWSDHDVVQCTHDTVHYRHPLVGDVTMNYELLSIPDDPEQCLILKTVEPGSVSAQALKVLAGLTSDASGLT